jgi:nicotinate-nucleotide adenylyltransferase
MIQEIFDDSAPIDGTVYSVGNIDALSPKRLYTYELLQRYRNMFRKCNLFFIVGSDNLKEFNIWKQPEKIFELANIIVIGRGIDDIPEIINSNPILLKNIGKIHELKLKRNSLSSSLIRNWLKNKEVTVVGRYLPRKVFNYIRKHKLYEK